MIIILKKYHISSAYKKIVLLIIFSFASFYLFAQQDTVIIDTVVRLSDKLDSAVQQVEPTVEEEDYQETDVAYEKEYFVRKNLLDDKGTDPPQLRTLSDSIKKALQNDDAFWYANVVFNKEKEKKEKNNKSGIDFGGSVFETILWVIIIAGFAIFLVIFLSNSQVGLFRRNKKITNVAEDDIANEDIFSINYQKEIDKATMAGDYRLAIRLMYLRLLKTLADKSIIQYKTDSTNFDYLMQIRGTERYEEFFRLTRNYEYTWYGQFAVDQEKFSVIKNDFETFERKLK